MNNLNSVLIEGEIFTAPLIKSTPSGAQVCTFTLESRRFYQMKKGIDKEVSHFNVEAWGKLAENCAALGHTGRGIRVVGRLKEYHWTARDGEPVSRVTIVAEHVEFRPEFKQGETETKPVDEEELQPLPGDGEVTGELF